MGKREWSEALAWKHARGVGAIGRSTCGIGTFLTCSLVDSLRVDRVQAGADNPRWYLRCWSGVTIKDNHSSLVYLDRYLCRGNHRHNPHPSERKSTIASTRVVVPCLKKQIDVVPLTEEPRQLSLISNQPPSDIAKHSPTNENLQDMCQQTIRGRDETGYLLAACLEPNIRTDKLVNSSEGWLGRPAGFQPYGDALQSPADHFLI
jgi:hypothetical protein